ncbi:MULTISPECIES: endonuclease/exonuclease/phosphatase family protein [unclassified Leucobacter]|uniref:endonuclease/exonuclease/phosphatase family protein n=1 Tax=unclassified Leucobacter TaxID=2621730 RepID=UPI00165DBBC2|nr:MULTISPECIES: endonuclease/exonuclease/phosphatase family protein [unclassified Leucobacter]MBC9927590.1 endonuclease/exonuclease/phosphatase family protein [Leucobacter sp. cx-169]
MTTLQTNAPSAEHGPPRRPRTPRVGLARVTFVAGVALGILLALHLVVPDVGGLALALDSGLPWLGILLPPLIFAALLSRARAAIAAAVATAAVWCAIVVPLILPLSWTAPPVADAHLTIASQNVRAGSGTAAETAQVLAAQSADVVALQEMDAESRGAAAAVLDARYPYSYGAGTIGVWSVYPFENATMLDLGLGWSRGLSVDLVTPSGPVSLYVVHAASARLGDHGDRDTMLVNLADTLERDVNDRVIAVGDFNASSTDRSLRALTSVLAEPRQSGGGFGFTWPSTAPIMRIDHLFQRGMDVVANTTLRAGQSDHRAIVATLNL